MFLVTAAHGNQCRPLIPRLIAAGIPVRALRRTEGRDQELLDIGVKEVIVGELSDPAVIERAMDGVTGVFHVGPSAHPKERELGIAMVEGAMKAGVQHFIYSSVLHPILTGLLQHERKRDVEEKLLESGLNFTIVQPADFFQTVQYRHSFTTGEFKLIWGGDKRQSLVDLDDTAEVVAKIVAEGPAHYGATYELSSADCLSPQDIADQIGSVMGKPVKLVLDSIDDFLTTWFGDAYSREAMASEYSTFKALSNWYGTYDFVGNPNVMTWLLGRKPNSFKQFLQSEYDARDRPHQFAGQGKVYEPLD